MGKLRCVQSCILVFSLVLCIYNGDCRSITEKNIDFTLATPELAENITWDTNADLSEKNKEKMSEKTPVVTRQKDDHKSKFRQQETSTHGDTQIKNLAEVKETTGNVKEQLTPNLNETPREQLNQGEKSVNSAKTTDKHSSEDEKQNVSSSDIKKNNLIENSDTVNKSVTKTKPSNTITQTNDETNTEFTTTVHPDETTIANGSVSESRNHKTTRSTSNDDTQISTPDKSSISLTTTTEMTSIGSLLSSALNASKIKPSLKTSISPTTTIKTIASLKPVLSIETTTTSMTTKSQTLTTTMTVSPLTTKTATSKISTSQETPTTSTVSATSMPTTIKTIASPKPLLPTETTTALMATKLQSSTMPMAISPLSKTSTVTTKILSTQSTPTTSTVSATFTPTTIKMIASLKPVLSTEKTTLMNIKSQSSTTALSVSPSTITTATPQLLTTQGTPTTSTVSASFMPSIVEVCKQNINCKLPSCFCPTFDHYINKTDIPQIVYFAFDDEVQFSYKQFYDTLFHNARKNPNGCPITMTLYVSHANTDYSLVKYYYGKGNEIASHSVTHKLIKTKKSVLQEAKQQKENIVNLANIPADQVTGWRSPYLEPAGDDQVEALQSLGYKYDISHTYIELGRTAKNTKDTWPFTLDHSGWPHICQILSCPKSKHGGFWEVPINVLSDLKQSSLCAFADSCSTSPSNKNEVFDYLWNNFKVNYRGNRAPFGIHLHARWFYTSHNLKGVDKFITELLRNDDVYIVSVQKMLDWMRSPTELSEIKTFKPWLCDEIAASRSVVTSSNPTTTMKSQETPSTKSQPRSLSVVQSCKQGVNCKLPSCFCPTFEHTMDRKDIPQIVYFGFDDEVQWSYKRHYDKLFLRNKRNPNGCPISMTLFVSHYNTDYNLVRYYYDKGNEIASHSVTHSLIKTRSSIQQEAKNQRDNIAKEAGIPSSSITGWRSPYLEPAGDDQVDVLKTLGYQYDVSHTYIPLGRPTNPTEDPWPFTLDYSGWPFICQILTCPKSKHKGFWEVPINVLSDPSQSNLCAFVDSCTNQPSNASQVYSYLMHNFEVNYKGNRAPFGLHLHARWFNTNHNIQGVGNFIKAILSRNDVYIISIQKMLEWIKNPVKLDNITEFTPWSC